MRVVYIADNGTEFETEKECMEYESPLDEFKVKDLDDLWMSHSGSAVAEFIFREFKNISKIMRRF